MTIIIYGGTGGIGSAMARSLRDQGRGVHLVGRRAAALETLARDIGATFTVGDVLDPGLFPAVAAAASGPIAGLAYAVGSITLTPLARTSAEQMLADFRLNALGAAEAVKSALPGMKLAGQGAVVLFSSVAAGMGFPGHTSIGMAKGAVEALGRTLAAELAPQIRVNVIAPSLTRTPLATALTNGPMAAAIEKLHPLQRLGTAEDSAALACFLLSPAAGWITGQVIGVDGGRAALAGKS